jgi:hypothetical protein
LGTRLIRDLYWHRSKGALLADAVEKRFKRDQASYIWLSSQSRGHPVVP